MRCCGLGQIGQRDAFARWRIAQCGSNLSRIRVDGFAGGPTGRAVRAEEAGYSEWDCAEHGASIGRTVSHKRALCEFGANVGGQSTMPIL